MSGLLSMMDVALPGGRKPAELPTLTTEQLPALARALSGRPGATVRLDARWPWCTIPRDDIHLPDPSVVAAHHAGRAMATTLAFLLHECEHLLLDRDLSVRNATLGHRLDGVSPAGLRALAHRRRWGWRYAVLWEVAADIRVDRSARRDFPWACAILRDTDESDHWRGGDPRVALAAQSPVTQVRDAILLVGREVCGGETLPGALGEALAATPVFLPLLDTRSDLTLVDHVAALLCQIESLARGPRHDTRARFARRFFDDALNPPPPPLRCGCYRARRDHDPVLDHDRDPYGRGMDLVVNASTCGLQRLPRYEVATREHDLVRTFTPGERARLRGAYRALPKRLPREALALLEGVLAWAELPGPRRPRGGREQGARLDPARWSSIASRSGDTAVWMDAVRVRAPDLALCVLVDQSGSMNTRMGNATRIEVARGFAAALHHALVDVAHAVVGFTTRPDAGIDWSKLDLRVAAGERFEGCVRVRKALLHTVFVGFDEDDGAALAAMSAADGLNYDAEALRFAHELLEAREARRRMLIVLSDGHPSPATSASAGATERAALLETVRAIERAGTRVLGVGMGCDAVRDYYAEHLLLTD